MDEQSSQTPINPQNLLPAKKSANWFLIITIGLGVVIVALAGAVFYLWQKNNPAPAPSTALNEPNRVVVVHDPNYIPTSTQGQLNQVQSDQQQASPESYVSVNWLPAWVPLAGDSNTGYSRVKVGKITAGKYQNFDLNIEMVQEMGVSYRHYVNDNGTLIYFDDQAVNIKIRGVDDIPDTIIFPGTNYTLKKNWVTGQPYSEIKKTFKVFTDPKLGDFYLTDNGCFVVELPDHTAVTYDYILPFVNKDTRALEVKYPDSSVNVDPYTYTRITGCGADCMYLATMDEQKLQPQVRLSEAGKLSDGEPMYGFIDPNAAELKSLYNDKNTVAYYNQGGNYEQLPKSKYTYAQFLNYHPLLYWKDPIGRWIEFKNDRFQIAAEMCKPVIYLYPKKATEMEVRVSPNGGFTFTKPVYNNGWHVVAYPDGTVKNIADGQKYPYLFWEGIGLNYPEQDAGFIVKYSELDSFLNIKLAAVGLAGREVQDFKAYWLPRMRGLKKAYYRITFLKKEQMDEIAPLGLSVKPNSVIRVMMTAKGLDAPENLTKQELPVPAKRAGFTLVEWGGTILR